MSYESADEAARKSTAKIFSGDAVLTGGQIRAARAFLRWSSERLAKESGISWGTVQNAEKTDGVPDNMQLRNLMAIKTALIMAGIEFTNGDEPGVKLRARGRRK